MSETHSASSNPKKTNTIILEFGNQKKDRIRDLREGRGRLFKQVIKTISQLQEGGEVGDSVQPVIVIVKQKRSSNKGLWD
jgi:hypothetical protein